MVNPQVPSGCEISKAATVAIIMAMEAEAASLRDALAAQPTQLPSWASSLPCRAFRAPRTSTTPQVLLVLNGTDPLYGVDAVGSTAAALATNLALNMDAAKPDLVLSVGTAGGWQRANAKIGDAFFAWPNFACHDRRIALPGFDAMGESKISAADLRAHAQALDCRLGIVTSGDSLDESPTDRMRILANGAQVKDMESAAVAWVAQMHGVPVGAIKTITDLVDSAVATEAQFVENLAKSSEKLRLVTLALLERLA